MRLVTSFSVRELGAISSIVDTRLKRRTILSFTLSRKMNPVVFGLLLVCCNAWEVTRLSEDTMTSMEVLYDDDLIIKFLEKLKTIMRNGNETLGIPILDPFMADQLKISYSENKVNFDADLSNVRVYGLSQYFIASGNLNTDFKTINISFYIAWPTVVASTNYSLKANFGNIGIYGKGGIKMFAEGFHLKAQINLLIDGGIIEGHLKIQDINLILSLDMLQFKVTGLYDDDEFSKMISTIISDMAPKIIKCDEVKNKVIELVRKKLDPFLASKTVWEILAMLR